MKKLICLMAFLFAVPCFAHFHYVNVDDGEHALTPKNQSIIASITSDAGEEVWDVRCISRDEQGRINPEVMWQVYYNNETSYFYGSVDEVFCTFLVKPKDLKVTKTTIRAILLSPLSHATVQFNSQVS